MKHRMIITENTSHTILTSLSYIQRNLFKEDAKES